MTLTTLTAILEKCVNYDSINRVVFLNFLCTRKLRMVNDFWHQNNDFHFDHRKFPRRHKSQRLNYDDFPERKLCESKQQSDGKSSKGKSISIRLYLDYERLFKQGFYAQLRLIRPNLRQRHLNIFPSRRWKVFHVSIK